MESQQGYAEVNGTRLYYETAGAGQPLVLLHAFSFDARMWDDQFSVFARQYRVVRYDARGFGRSAVPVEGAGYAHEDDLRSLLTHLGIAQAHLLGLSLGGGTALNFALADPQATASLVLVDSILDGFVPPAAPTALGPLASVVARQAAREGGADAGRAAWLGAPMFAPAREQPAVAARLRAMVGDWSAWHLLHDDPQRRGSPPAAQRLGEIRASTLVVVGERDRPRLQCIADALAEGIRDARKAVLPGVGHMANMEAPQLFNDLVLDFLGEASGPRREELVI